MGWIKNWIIATFILTFLVIAAGAVVRTTQSGMGCPDWPKCFGRWIPPTNVSELPADYEKYLRKQDIDHRFNAFHTWVEYFNRLLGALLGVFAIIQSIKLFSKRDLFRKAWYLSLAFLLTVILTGLFGAVVVKLNLAHFSISVHLLFAIVLIQIQLALLLSIYSKMSALVVEPTIKKMLFAFLITVLVQSIFGTMVRMHVDDISKLLNYEQRETWLIDDPVVFLVHRSFSWIVLLFALCLTWYPRKNQQVKNHVFLLCGIVVLSMITGIILFYAHMPAVAQPIHLLLATFAITQVVNILFQSKPAGIVSR